MRKILRHSRITMVPRRSTSNLVNLARKILAKSEVINGFCEGYGHPHRTLAADSPSTMLPSNTPKELLSLQYEINDAAAQIQQLTTDDNDFLAVQAAQNNQLACLKWLCHFRVPQIIPLHGTISYDDAANKAKVPKIDLRSVARMAMLTNFLREPIPGRIGHSSTSASFVKDPALLDLATFLTKRSAPMAMKMVDSTVAWGSSSPRDHTAYQSTAYNIENKTDLPIFQHVESDPELREEYGNYMRIQSQGRGMNIKNLLDGFDWNSLGDSVVVDVGGNLGNASFALASAFPNLKFIVQDLPSAIKHANDNLDAIPPVIKPRIQFQEHNFFAPQPIQQVDVFLLRMIIHDWRDAESVTILKHLTRALQPGGKIIIMDTVMPEHGSMPRFQEMILRTRDLTMLQAHNNNERDLAEWKSLIQSVDKSLHLKNVKTPLGSLMAVLELCYEP